MNIKYKKLMTTLVAKFDEDFLKLPELKKYLGKEVVVIIEEKQQSNEDLRKFFDLAGKNEIYYSAFDFLKDENEDIYTINDGEPIDD